MVMAWYSSARWVAHILATPAVVPLWPAHLFCVFISETPPGGHSAARAAQHSSAAEGRTATHPVDG